MVTRTPTREDGPGAPHPPAPATPDGDGASPTRAPAGELRGVPIEVPLGRRVMVLGDLRLPAEPSPSSRALAADLATTLERWQGPGLVVVCGDLFDTAPGAEVDAPGPPGEPGEGARRAMESHGELRQAVRTFTGRAECRLIVLPGWRDGDAVAARRAADVLADLGAEVSDTVTLRLQTAAGERRVVVCSGAPATPNMATPDAGADARPWLTGLDRLEDPSSSRRFVTSRLLYRRLRRFLWVPPLVLVVAALALRLTFVFQGLSRVVRTGRGHRVLLHVYSASWSSRLLVTLLVMAVLLVVLAAVVGVTSRGVWRALGGGELPAPWGRRRGLSLEPPSVALRVEGRSALDEARELVAGGCAGLIAGGSLRAELTHLDHGFFASPGGTTELVREHPGRFGLPPVFLHHRQSSLVELETGADLHVRLLLADVDLPSSTVVERLVTPDHVIKGYKPAADVHPSMVASWPRGATWPAAPDVASERVTTRRVRRMAAAALFVAGLADLLSAITPPLRAHLRVVEHVVPLGGAEAVGALVALSGVGLLLLARGVLRGQRRSWLVAVALLIVGLVLHLVHGVALGGLLLTALVLLFLLVQRERFRAAADPGSWRSAAITLGVGTVAAVVIAFVVVEVSESVRHHPLPGWPTVLWGVTERLVGAQTVTFPARVNGFISPALLAVGVALVVVTAFLMTRPVVDRRLSASRDHSGRRAAELRARDIVRRHGVGTLDYFALRDDKHWFFHRDSLVAYAVYGGVCLVSPDPIGPLSERDHVWGAFRQYADRQGWAIGVMAAGEEWLPVYQASGMRHLYIGDEAVVDVRTFSLKGGKMKGLRQAVNRVERYGYTAHFVDPARIDRTEVAALVDLMGRNRRGEQERGFSMMLGRLFDPRDTGLLLTVVNGPGGEAVAMCQFVPSPAINGYSLDLMRRDPGEHPNGLIDFALCATIDELRRRGARGLSLNFAAMRSVLEGETGDGVTQRVERWALRRLSGVLQIESLWRFNAKYEPDWLPRYIVYDSAEQFVPTAVQIMRAESLTEVPVFGRLLNTAGGRAGPMVPEELTRAAAGTPGTPGDGAPGTDGAPGA